jgi:hypothetical protein
MDVCDKVTTEDSGAKDAVASMIKRLAHRNANVQLYTLEVRKPALSICQRDFTDACLVACECPQPELRSKDAPGARVKGIHRRPITASQRSKYTSASQGEDSRADARMGGDVQRPRSWNHE